MNAGIATSLALLLYGVAIVPVAWLAWRPASARWLAPTLGLAVVGMAFHQTGVLNRGDLATADVTHLLRADTPEGRCEQVFDLLIDNGVLLEQPDAKGLVVKGATWDQLPSPVREAVVACAQSTLGGERGGEPSIVRR